MMVQEIRSNPHHFQSAGATEDTRNRKVVWLLAVGLFTLIALWPIWSVRYPPLQDYPVHLLHVQMLQSQGDADFTYNQYFDFRIWPIYATFFVTTNLYASVFPIETAGKLFLTTYVLVIALLALRAAQKMPFTPWGLLLLFPFAFNQQYFYGFTNYMFSIPLLVFALLDHDDLVHGSCGIGPMARQGLWQLAILFTHPFTFLLYVGFLCVGTILFLREGNIQRRSAVMPFFFSIPLTVWIFFIYRSQGGTDISLTRLLWKPFVDNLCFYASMFTGMRLGKEDRPDMVSVSFWIILALVTAGAWRAWRRERLRLPKAYVAYFLLATTAVFIAPFAKDFYTFINWRMTTVSYFLLALLVGYVRFTRVWKPVFVGVVAGLLVFSVTIQWRVSAEIAQIDPIIEAMPADAHFLPLVFDNNSPVLDRFFFDPHLHGSAYYHLRYGNGFSPYGLDAPLHPVRFKPDVDRPGPNPYEPHLFRWEDHANGYRFLLVRGAPPEFSRYVQTLTQPIITSGSWQLLKCREHD